MGATTGWSGAFWNRPTTPMCRPIPRSSPPKCPISDARDCAALDRRRGFVWELLLGGRALSGIDRRRLCAGRFHDHRPQSVRSLTLGIALLLIAAAASYGSYYWVVGRFLESTDDAYVQADSTIIAPKVSDL